MRLKVALTLLLSVGLSGCDAMQRLDVLNAQLASTNAKLSQSNAHLRGVKHDTASMDERLEETNERLAAMERKLGGVEDAINKALGGAPKR